MQLEAADEPVNQDPNYFYKAYDGEDSERGKLSLQEYGVDTSQKNIDRLLSEIAFYRHKVKLLVGHGYHVESRAQHNDGRHY